MKSLENFLIPTTSQIWKAEDIPLEARGINGEWLYRFILAIHEYRDTALENYYLQQQGAIQSDDVPWPNFPAGLDEELNKNSFVRDHVLPLTRESEAPLFARVPKNKQGTPSVFVTYTWNSGFLADGYGVVYAIQRYLSADNYIWMDVFSQNQHGTESRSGMKEKVIAGVDRLLLPMSQYPWYECMRCVGEVICAVRLNKEVVFLEYARQLRDYRQIRKYFLGRFDTIAKATATSPDEKEEILHLAKATFGSVEAADSYLANMMRLQLEMPM